MKTNRRKYRTFSRHGDFLFTKREANKRNRKDVKKMLTNIAQYVIISISKEREVIHMKKYYRVTVKVDATYDIKANTEEEAIERAKELAKNFDKKRYSIGKCSFCEYETQGDL